MPRSQSDRRGGGQPDNTNRLIHGRYSIRLTGRLTGLLGPRTGHDPDLEIALARVRLVRLIQAQERAPSGQRLSYERAVIDGIALIVSLISAHGRNQRLRPDVRELLRHLQESEPDRSKSAVSDLNHLRTSPSDDAIAP